MRISKISSFLSQLAVMLVCLEPLGLMAATTLNLETNQPIIAGNVMLHAGAYTLKGFDSPARSHVVEITDRKTRRLVSTVVAIPAYRSRVSPANNLVFWETPRGVPRAIRAWFAPGQHEGEEFTYPGNLVASLQSTQSTIEPTTPPGISLKHEMVAANKPELLSASARMPALLPARRNEVSKKPASPEGSWALITGSEEKPDSGGFWQTLRNLPFTATLTPLIGLTGVVALSILGVTYLRRRRPLHDK